MASLLKRVTSLEDAVMKHLTESGEIRADIKWLKKANTVQNSALVSILVVLLGAITTYVLRH